MIVGAPPRPIRVGIADDSNGMRVLIRSMLLRDGGFEIAGEAGDGAEAVGLAEREQPDVLLLDLAMPVMDGLEAIPRLRRAAPRTRIAILSGFEASHMEQEAVRAGADAYVSKGATPGELVELLRGLCPGRGRPAGTAALHEESESLLQAADRYEALVQEVTDHGIFMLDPSGLVESWNRGAARITGYPAEEIIGRHFSCFYPLPDVVDGRPERALAEAAASGRFEEEGWRLRKDGTRLWTSVVINALRDENGELRGFAKVTRDASGRHAVEESLRREKEHLAEIIDTSLVAVVGVDGQDRIVTWSRRAEQTFGWKREEVLGRTARSTVVPEWLHQRYDALLHEFLGAERPDLQGTLVRVSALRRDGSEFPAELAISPPLVDDDGSTEIVAFVRDLSDQVRTERMRSMQFRVTRILALAPNLPAAATDVLQAIAVALEWPLATLWLVDPAAGRLRQAGAWHGDDGGGLESVVETGAVTSLAPGEGLPGAVWRAEEVVSTDRLCAGPPCPRHDAMAEAGLSAAAGFPILNRGAVVGVVELLGREVTPPDEATISVMSDLGQRLGQFVERVRVMEDLVRSNAELVQKAADLERSNTDLAQFARVASHDLQEPLRMVTSYVQLLERRYRGRLDQDADEYIGFAVEGALRMQALIGDLLAYSQAGRATPERTEVDTARCVAEAEANLSSSIGESGAVLVVGELPRVQGDETQLVQLFQNLIGNALKFRGEAAPRIEIGAVRQGPWWTFSVSDNGIGIAAEHAERVFQVFQRLHNRERYPGTGIGLALCRKVVDRLGGRIWVESTPGHGATFRFTLPFTDRVDEENEA